MKEGAVLLFLGLNTVSDLKKREINLYTVVFFGVLGIVWKLLEHDFRLTDLISVGIGIGFLFISVLTKGEIGMGDAWILLVMGMLTSMEVFLISLSIGLVLASIWSGYLLMVQKRRRDTEIPFLPFLFLGYLGGIYLC